MKKEREREEGGDDSGGPKNSATAGICERGAA